VFDHVHFPEAGTQVPGGTIEVDERPESAALREANEETGISNFYDVCLLANEPIDMRPFGKDEMLDAWFYHLKTGERTGECWQHAEMLPSDGGTEPIWFKLYWVHLFDKTTLNAVDTLQLEAVRRRIKNGGPDASS